MKNEMRSEVAKGKKRKTTTIKNNKKTRIILPNSTKKDKLFRFSSHFLSFFSI